MNRAHRVGLGGVLLLVAAVYSVALGGPFQFDDLATVAVDPGAQSIAAWWDGAARHVRPLTKLSFVLSHALGEALGHVPAGHRLANLGIHLSAVAMFCALGLRIAATCCPTLDARGATAASLAAAAMLGLHPLATEGVSYLSGRSMSLGTLLAAASLWAYIRWRTDSRRAWLLAAVFAGIGAAFARETAAVAPLLWVLWEMARKSPSSPPFSARRLWAVGPVALATCLGVGAFILWLFVHPRYAPLLEHSRLIATGRTGEASFAVMLQYLVSGLALLRYPTIDPDVSPALLSAADRLLVIGGLSAATAVAWAARRTRPHLMFCLVWAGLWLAPLYAFPVRYDAVAERHFYPVIWGVAFGLCLEAFRGWSAGAVLRRQAQAAAALAAGLALSIVTLTRNADYRSEVALWEAARRGAPAKVRVLNNLGVAYMEAGRWDEAEAVLRQAVALAPADELASDNLLIAEQREFGPVRWPQRDR